MPGMHSSNACQTPSPTVWTQWQQTDHPSEIEKLIGPGSSTDLPAKIHPPAPVVHLLTSEVQCWGGKRGEATINYIILLFPPSTIIANITECLTKHLTNSLQHCHHRSSLSFPYYKQGNGRFKKVSNLDKIKLVKKGFEPRQSLFKSVRQTLPLHD